MLPLISLIRTRDQPGDLRPRAAALEALSGIWRRYNVLTSVLRVAAENLEPSIAYGLNTFVDQFAVAMKRSTSPNTGSERKPQPIETAPRDGRFLILEEDASGKFNIARWAPEASGWVRENDEPIKIIPSYWYPIQGQNDSRPRLDIVSTPVQPERPAAPQRQLATDIIAAQPSCGFSRD